MLASSFGGGATMDSKLDIIQNALIPFTRTTIPYNESIGLFTLEPTTAVVNADGRLELVPLDILSSAVNLKTMWLACDSPVGIVFREMIDDWYAVVPVDATLLSWKIVNMPGKDHMIYRARQLAERAIRSDFGVEMMRVTEF
jgi:hypothetical protein